MENINGQMEPFIKDFGKKIDHLDMVNYIIKMEIFMREIGKTEKLMDMENIWVKKVGTTEGNGKMTCSMEEEWKLIWLINLNLLVLF